MAQRFGGKYSPPPQQDTPNPGTPARKSDPRLSDIPSQRRPRTEHPLEGRPFWIMICALPFLLGAFGAGPVALARAIAAFALCGGGAFLLREGLRAQAAYESRSIARRPAIPRKIFGAVTIGIGIALGASSSSGIAAAIGTGAMGAILALAAFGLDPLRDKGVEGVDHFQNARVARAVETGEAHLEAMRDAIARAKDRQLTARVEIFAQHARELFRAVEEDPNDLASARRYMGIYLEGARDATIKFADLWQSHPDPSARQDYERLLDDLEANFTARTQQLIQSGREDLDIEIDVLRERLEREGIVLPEPSESESEAQTETDTAGSTAPSAPTAQTR